MYLVGLTIWLPAPDGVYNELGKFLTLNMLGLDDSLRQPIESSIRQPRHKGYTPPIKMIRLRVTDIDLTCVPTLYFHIGK